MSAHRSTATVRPRFALEARSSLLIAALVGFAAPPCLAAENAQAPAVAASAADAKLASPLPNAVKTDYRIAPRDLVQFQIFEDPDLLSVQRVSESGEIGIPMLGTFHVGGMTLREAEQAMKNEYVKDGYYIKPQVILSVQTYAPRNVSILGQVNKAEQIDFPVERDQISIVQAITLAGGFTRVAKADLVKVIRTVDGKEQQFTVNVTAYLDKNTGSEFMLLPDDVVYVPERVF